MVSYHLRNTEPMLTSPRCCASTRSGKSCRSPAVAGTQRCRMHAGNHSDNHPDASSKDRKFLRHALHVLSPHGHDPDVSYVIERIEGALAAMEEPSES
ncbi:MAG: hypothetical protein AB7F98_17775 [Novosphingobium sp.]